jgi:uroporphyrin-III C-methyltransferase
VIGKVKDVYFKAEYHQLTNPAVIIIGEVVNLHPSFLRQSVFSTPDQLKIFKIAD